MGGVEMANAMDVADSIIVNAQEVGHPVSNLQLQKIMYFLNAIHLVDDNGTPLIDDDHFEKWDYGPVIRSVYSEYSIHGANTITEPARHTILAQDNQTGRFRIQYHKFNPNNLTQEENRFIETNLNRFLGFDPFFLVNESHLEPQWREKEYSIYDNQRTINFYTQPQNRFWEN